MRTAAVSRYLFYPLALIGASLAAPALAAPQILAVAATELPLPLTCEAGECRVELTTICLQEERASPNPGAGYYVHGERFFEITGVTETGQEISLAHLPVTITAARGHNAVRVAFRAQELKKYGPLEVSLKVPENLSLVPLPIRNDRRPQTDADIELATGPNRALARLYVEEAGDPRAEAELLSQAINRLPERGRASDTERAAVRDAYPGIAARAAMPASAKAGAAAHFEACYRETTAGSLSLRACLSSWHDRLIGKLNTNYWHALRAGS